MSQLILFLFISAMVRETSAVITNKEHSCSAMTMLMVVHQIVAIPGAPYHMDDQTTCHQCLIGYMMLCPSITVVSGIIIDLVTAIWI